MNQKAFGLLVVLGLLASSFLILFLHRSMEERPEDTIQEQWRAITNRQLTKAYFAYTSKEYQELTTLKEFKELVNYLPQAIGNDALELSEVEDDFPIIVIEGLIQGASDLKLYYEMLLHNGVWKVDRMLLLEEA